MKKVYVVTVEVHTSYWSYNGEFTWKTMDDAVAFINVVNDAYWEHDVRYMITPKTVEGDAVEDGDDNW